MSTNSLHALLLCVLGSSPGCLADLSPDPRAHFGGTHSPGDASSEGGSSRTDAGSAWQRDAQAAEGGGYSDGGDGVVPAPPTDSGAQCDLSGRWLVTEHMVSTILGANQVQSVWYYVEIAQQSADLTFTKSLACGTNVKAQPPFEVKTDERPAWPAFMANPSYGGRRGTSAVSADGCLVQVEKMFLVRGATPSVYVDPTVPLPEADQPASGSTPGWEDWDNDGNPGFTVRISGAVSGRVYTASRSWTQWSGTSVGFGTQSLKVPLRWNSERKVLGIDGSSLLASPSAPLSDPSAHFALLARLSDDQATGDDAAVCEAVRSLAATLAPEAN